MLYNDDSPLSTFGGTLFDYKSGANDIGAKPPSLQEMPWRQLRGGAKTGPLGSW